MDYKKDNNFDPHPRFVQDVRQVEERKAFHRSFSQRTEKVATAIYMVTSHIDDREMVRNAFRDASLALVLDTVALEDPMQAPEEIFQSIAVALEKLQSLTNLTSSIGMLSAGNARILSSELGIIREQCAIGHKYYALSTLDDVLKTLYPQEQSMHPEIGNGQSANVLLNSTEKKDIPAIVPVKEEINQPIRSKKKESLPRPVASNSDRKEQILKLIKDKGEVSIKDISSGFAGCSEKTIQRDINALVEEGKLKKSGDRRWSKYAIKR